MENVLIIQAPAWTSSAGAKDLASNRQGVEAPWTTTLVQKYTRRYINHQNNPIDGATQREGKAYAQGK